MRLFSNLFSDSMAVFILGYIAYLLLLFNFMSLNMPYHVEQLLVFYTGTMPNDTSAPLRLPIKYRMLPPQTLIMDYPVGHFFVYTLGLKDTFVTANMVSSTHLCVAFLAAYFLWKGGKRDLVERYGIRNNNNNNNNNNN
eukprot:PhM_4_TR7145/c0_g1_i1/m.22175